MSASNLRSLRTKAFRGTQTHRSKLQVVAFQRNHKRLWHSGASQRLSKEPLLVSIEPDGSDSWRLDPVITLIQQGGVGIIPTDTLPAIVCDLENRDAVLRLYQIKELNPKKPLSILCNGLSEISRYTAGFPASNLPGQPNWFNVVKRVLPGPYTIILPASKSLPSQCVDLMKGKTIHRKSVGVRWPKDSICQAVLAGVGHPLLATSAHAGEVLTEGMEVPDVGSMLEAYGSRGLDFIVDVGPHVVVASSVVDMTGPQPEVVRQGQGDTSMFEV